MFGAYAQKEYITVLYSVNHTSSGSTTYTTIYGNVPEGMTKSNSSGGLDTTMEIITKLSELGYTLENVTPQNRVISATDYHNYNYYLFSKPVSSIATQAKHITTETDNAEVTEVARYNLQGMPVDTTEKGIQIVVYSNYTTKTVIVE